MTKRWETPVILAISALPKALGDCLGGSTDGATAQGECGCHNGDNTLGVPVRIATTPGNTSPSMHGCSSGGTPSGCFCGDIPTLPDN